MNFQNVHILLILHYLSFKLFKFLFIHYFSQDRPKNRQKSDIDNVMTHKIDRSFAIPKRGDKEEFKGDIFFKFFFGVYCFRFAAV